MIWIKSVLVGLAAAIVTVVATVIATSFSTISTNVGSGGIGAVSAGLFEFLLSPFVLAFVLAFLWMFRRQRGRQSRSRVSV